MAEDKKGFLLYADLIHTIEKMPNDKAGLLFKHILNYVNDLNPVTDDLIVELTFEPIKQQLKRDLLKYKETKIDKSNGGKLGNLKRWHKDLHDKVIKNELDINEALEIANNRKTSHTDNMQSQPIAEIAVNVNDNVSVNVNDNDNVKEKLNKQLIISSTPKNEFSESVNNFYDYVLKYFEEKFIPKTDKQISSWKECIDKLIRIDGYDLKHIHEIIKTFREDNFWKTNFNSLPKLREKNNTGEKYIDVFSVKLKNKNQNGKQSTIGETRDEINDRAKREISTSIINTLNGELRDQFGH